ncbi:MAG: hypothetical protein RML40_07950 [Bacteroidota bacterium]|nr:hypothetical protein [Candidatus Kapabacteria bacterium]MDW8220447.1 hypothetical protein [Bacteroidota bacterium]
MFEREIQRAKELLTEHLPSARQFVYWHEIRECADIPVFYRNFFGAEVQWWIFEEQLQRISNPRFDYSHEQLASAVVEADRFRMEAARFDHQDLMSTIDLAVKTRFNYILRPRTTLKWFVFRGEPTKTLSEIMLRMDYFLEYDYLLDGFRRWIATKQDENSLKNPSPRQASLVSVVEFDRMLQIVDNDTILDYSTEEFTDLLTPIFDMFNEIHATDRILQQYRGKAPLPAIIIFLDDKGIYRIAQELEEMMKTHALRYISQRDFLHLLNDIVNKLEHQTPVSVPFQSDSTTLPITFTEESIIRAEDTIGELAIGTNKRIAQSSSYPDLLPTTPPAILLADDTTESDDYQDSCQVDSDTQNNVDTTTVSDVHTSTAAASSHSILLAPQVPIDTNNEHNRDTPSILLDTATSNTMAMSSHEAQYNTEPLTTAPNPQEHPKPSLFALWSTIFSSRHEDDTH